MARTTRIIRWNKGLALRLPTSVASQVGIDAGVTVELSVESGAIVIRLRPAQYSLADLVQRITLHNCHREAAWARSAGNEAW